MNNECDDDIVDGEFDSVEFASYLYQEARAQGLVINATKLQKWLYICYGVYLVRNNKRLLTEQPKAWPYGPVFPRLHKAYNPNFAIYTPSISLTAEHTAMVESILNHFGNWTANGLSNWTHQDNFAWAKTRQKHEKFNTPIPDELIIQDFQTFVRKRNE